MPRASAAPTLYTVRDLCRILGTTPRSVHARIATGSLAAPAGPSGPRNRYQWTPAEVASILVLEPAACLARAPLEVRRLTLAELGMRR